MVRILTDILKRRFSFESMMGELSPLLTQITLAMSRRPELIERLLKMERNFMAAKNLGEFLRGEEVILEKPRAKTSSVTIFVIFVLGFFAAVFVQKFLR